jgi:hypothetical protein
VDGDEVTDPVLELCLRHAREQRNEITLWLAVQVLISDDVALADALQDRLVVLQDRIENMMRPPRPPRPRRRRTNYVAGR